MKTNKQYLFYLLFAVISTLINILVQFGVEYSLGRLNSGFLSFKLHHNLTVLFFLKMSIAIGAAFIFKYIVDRWFIFQDHTREIKLQLKQLRRYTQFAVLTTIIFISIETLFKRYLVFEYSEYLGAVIGLSIGYTMKFFLDKKYVFNQSKAA